MNVWLKLPGLFHRFEIDQAIEVDGEHEYCFKPAGRDDRGRELIAIYCRAHRSGGAALIDLSTARPRSVPEGGAA